MQISLTETAAELKAHERIVITAHVNPDGDAIGSSLGLMHALKALGKEVQVFIDDDIPAAFSVLPGYELIGKVEEGQNIPADLLVAVDVSLDRIGRVKEAVNAPTLNIDHHITNPGFADVNYIEDCAATGELVCLLYEAFRKPISAQAGVCLYTAIATDTGNFAYSSVTPRTFALMGRVMESGFDLPECNRLLYRNERLQKLRMTARTVENAKLYRDEQVIVGTLSKAETEAVGGLKADAEGIIDSLRDVETVIVACFLREEGENEVKLSLRAKDRVDCAALARAYGGGGHLRAAGATLHMSLAEAEAEVTKALLTAFDA